jgi:release factor glutamine methyltransferase
MKSRLVISSIICLETVMTIGDLRHDAVQRLKAAGIDEAEIEADLLLGQLFCCSRAQLVLARNQQVSAATIRHFENLLARRLRREPLAYIFGEWEFWSLPFEVNPAVLIPRPETEQLLEAALRALKADGGGQRLIDLGTGSGVIPVVLALELPEAEVYALDCSWPALRVAMANARRHGVADRIHFLASDWLAGIRRQPFFNAVLANPPYIACSALAGLEPEVREFEPHLALTAGVNGLDCIALLAVEITRILKPGGRLFMEIGFDQEEGAAGLLQAAGHYEDIQVHRDLAGHPRILQAKLKEGSG